MNTSLAILLALTSADSLSVTALRDLSSRRFPLRESAQRYLAGQMPRVRLLLQVHATHSPDAETRQRCLRILRDYRRSPMERVKWWAAVMPERWPHFDMVAPRMYGSLAEHAEPHLPDMLGHETRGELFYWYFQKAQYLRCRIDVIGQPDFEQYRAASLWYVADLERAGLEAWQVRELLDALVPLERGWYAGAGHARP